MRKVSLLVFLGLLSLEAQSQYSGPAVEACRAYAKKEEAKDNPGARDIVFDRDQSLTLMRQKRMLGNQPVTALLSGNGAVVLRGAPSAELSFICLLADEKRPVFFLWLTRPNVSAAEQCRRGDVPPRTCLDFIMQVVESDLTQVYANAFHEARARDTDAKNDASTDAYRKANAEWLQYRDAECARRRDLAPKEMSADDYHLACLIDLTRRRALDMR
jgi:uncharacterized protein YecT (DUF1311 family)